MTSAQDRHRILEAGQKLKLVPSGGKPSSLPVLLVLYAYSSLLLALGCFSFRVFQSVTREQRFDCSETRTVLNLEDVTAAFLAVSLSLSLSWRCMYLCWYLLTAPKISLSPQRPHRHLLPPRRTRSSPASSPRPLPRLQRRLLPIPSPVERRRKRRRNRHTEMPETVVLLCT